MKWEMGNIIKNSEHQHQLNSFSSKIYTKSGKVLVFKFQNSLSIHSGNIKGESGSNPKFPKINPFQSLSQTRLTYFSLMFYFHIL